MLGMEALRMALISLWSHKLRSAMTILGVVIGVASVLAVTSLGAAFEESITSQFDTLDQKTIFVTATATDVNQGPPDAGQFGLIFTEVDRQNLLALEGVETVLATGQVTVSGISVAGKDLPFRSLTGTTPDAQELRETEDYASGGPFALGAQEVVLGWSIAEQLGGDTPVEAGATMTITFEDGSTTQATVSGVLAKQESFFGSNNAQVFAPVDPFYSVKRESPSSKELVRVFEGFTVVADDPTDVDATRDRVEAYMTGESDAAALLADGLQIIVATPEDIQEGISSAFDQITIFIAAIAGVSLLVGGIMIGTVMLISVTERTKEIGMMKAIGALDREVLWMFLLEASLVGLFGSLLGIVIGLAGGYSLVEGLFGSEDVAFIVPWQWLGIAVAVGVGTGIIAGLFPARRAVRIEPVEALNYE